MSERYGSGVDRSRGGKSSFQQARVESIAAILVLLSFAWPALGQMRISTVRTGGAPAWVDWRAAEPPAASKSEQGPGGEVFTLIDSQVNAEKEEAFVHIIKEITSNAGVQSGANLQFSWDPSYQELTVHRIVIRRGGEEMDRLEPDKFRIIQQESDLSRQIYNGSLSAVIFLEDVRVGDRIEYAFTVRGANPSLKGRYSDRFFLGATVPIGERRVRLLWPTRRQLHFRVQGAGPAPEVRSRGALKEYIWDLHDVPGVVFEDQIPSWFPAVPWLDLSEFGSWSDVARWATGMFVITNLDAPELRQELTKLQSPGATPQDTVQRALEFVQNEIRYLGIEFGPNSYKPTDPATVLHRRFGDCKDKALLFCTLLRGLGCEATPALVSTGMRQTLSELLPDPEVFDHVIVRVVAGGATYWLDPTRTYQRGPVSQRYLPDYGLALLARDGETVLTRIPASSAGTPETVTSEIFDVGGQQGVTHLWVTSTFNGFDSEWMRAALTVQGREQIAKSWLNDYAHQYPSITPAGPIEVEDSSDHDTVTIVHSYSIRDFWTLLPDKERYHCEFYPQGIHTWIARPSTTVRSMPMEVAYPRRRLVRTTIHLPRDFAVSNFTNTIRGPAGELRVKHSCNGRTVTLNYEYQALTNFVALPLTAKHLATLERMEGALGYALNWQNAQGIRGQGGLNGWVFSLAVLYTTALSAGVLFLYRRQRRSLASVPPVPASGDDPELSKLTGLGGWLILVAINLILSPLRMLYYLSHSVKSFSPATWHALTSQKGMSYNPAWGPLLVLELLGQITVLTLSIFALVLFFQKRRVFPGWFIGLLVFNGIFVLADVLGVGLVKAPDPGKVFRHVAQVAVGCSVWIPYMLRSRRVKATFVS
ncbi:MAG TPA: DUF3857 domain-containing protein [Verrucomicrobiae bacterium]|nr:DUF3857 domain-containing protein [Verrucomicrobiae bacterium]